jgi:deoxyribonuclease-4
MSQAIDGVLPCLDLAHLHARPGDGSMNSYDEWAGCLESYRGALGEDSLKDLHIHLSGIEYGEKGEREHLPLDEADLDIEALFRALHDYDCQGRILCESPTLEEDALLMQSVWAKVSGGETPG